MKMWLGYAFHHYLCWAERRRGELSEAVSISEFAVEMSHLRTEPASPSQEADRG